MKKKPKFLSGSIKDQTKKCILTMKFIIILSLVSVFQIYGNSYAQSVKLTLNLRNVPLSVVIAEIENQSEFDFFYNNSQINLDQKVSVKTRKSSVYKILDKLLNQINLNYTVINKDIVITPVPEKNSSEDFSSGTMALQFSVTGRVIDIKEDGIPGVNVYLKGSSNQGTITDFSGNYQLEVADANATIVFSFVGYKTQEVSLESRTVIDVLLEEESFGMEEIVITALGIKRDKKSLGYSVSSIKSDELVKSGIPINPLSSLYGKAAGVRISSTSGGPTAGMIINIRNSVSLTKESNTRPLFVVDGIPIFDENTRSNSNDRDGRDKGTGINDINAEDIESIEILKGAKAAVLYGYAGANGVVLITTKTGKNRSGFGIDVSTSYTIDNIAFYPEFQNEFGTGSNVAYAGLDPALTDAQGFKYEMIEGTKTPVFFTGGGSFGPKMDGRDIRWWDGEMRPYSSQPNNYKELFETGNLRTTNVSFSNGGDLGSFRLSYTNKDYKGVLIGATQQNHIFSFNGNLKISERINIRLNSNYYYTSNHNAPMRMQDGFVTYGIRRDLKPGVWKNHITGNDGIYTYFRNNDIINRAGQNQVSGIGFEYLWNQTQNDYDELRHHFIQSINTDVKILDWLSFTFLGGFDMTRKENTVKKRVIKPLSEDAFQGYYSVAERNLLNFYTQSYLNFDKKIGDDFRINGLIGGVYSKNEEKFVKTVTNNFLVENWFSFINSTDEVKSEGEGRRGADLLYSALGSAQIAYKEFLFLEIQGRNDWTSILPPGNNSYFYPGASVVWIFSQSFELPEFIKFAKTRLSWADVGRPGPRYFGNLSFDINTYGRIPYVTSSSSLPPADFTGTDGGLPSENLKPERKREFEFGVEMNFFDRSRIGFDFSIYRNNVYNQIMGLDVPLSSGVKKVIINAGDVQQSGIELQLNGTPVLTKDFNWNVTFNFAHYKTEIIKLAKGIEIHPLWGVVGAQNLAKVGGEYGEIFINPFMRDENGNKVVGGNGIYMFDKENKKKVGVSVPNILGGFNTNFNYKGISLDLDFDYQFGGTLISQTNMYLKGNGTGTESLKYRDEARGGSAYYVNSAGEKLKLDSHSAPVPVDSKYSFIFHDGVVLDGIKEDGTTNDILISAQEYYENTYWQSGMDVTEDAIYKSDYIALRRITFSYNVPKSVLQKVKLQNLRLSLFGANIAYLYKDVPNVIPESTSGTNEFTEYSGMPGVRSFGFEIKLGF